MAGKGYEDYSRQYEQHPDSWLIMRGIRACMISIAPS